MKYHIRITRSTFIDCYVAHNPEMAIFGGGRTKKDAVKDILLFMRERKLESRKIQMPTGHLFMPRHHGETALKESSRLLKESLDIILGFRKGIR